MSNSATSHAAVFLFLIVGASLSVDAGYSALYSHVDLRFARYVSIEKGCFMAKLYKMCFSPTGGSKKVLGKLVEGMGQCEGGEVCELDLTKVDDREGFALSCGSEDLLVLAFPVYTGRVPLTLREAIAGIEGNGAKAVVVATYGNRHYDDAIREAYDFLNERGFEVVAAAAFSAEHSFTGNVGGGRPDADDLAKAVEFGRAIGAKFAAGAEKLAEVPGNFPYMDYQGNMPFHPATSEACTQCGVCVDVCPTANVDAETFETGMSCIQCGACIKVCPAAAKSFVDAPLLGIIGMLEAHCTARREPELFA